MSNNRWRAFSGMEVGMTCHFSVTFLLLIGFTSILISCGGGKKGSPPPPILDSASFGCGGSGPCAMTITLAQSQLDEIGTPDIPYPSCTLHAGGAPMVFAAGSSEPWFTVSPAVGNLQPGGETAVGVTAIDFSAMPSGNNTGFVIVDASGYNQLTGVNFEIIPEGNDSHGNPIFKYGYNCLGSCDPSGCAIVKDNEE
jgi:hypothetical protein